VVAAIGLQGREWLLAIGGQTMGNAENPVPMLAMLKHLANVQEKEGRKVNLEYSNCCRSCWTPWPPNPSRPTSTWTSWSPSSKASTLLRAKAKPPRATWPKKPLPRPPRPLTATASRRPEPAAAVTVYVDDAVHPLARTALGAPDGRHPGRAARDGGAARHSPRAFQNKASGAHYDVTAELRAQAIALGARAISRHTDRELVKAVIRAQRPRAQYRP
jgi:hypothetical protein